MRTEDIRARVTPQEGIVTRDALVRAGFSESSISRACVKGTLVSRISGIYRLNDEPPTERQNLIATLLWAGEGAALSYDTAAWVWEMEPFRAAPVHVSVPGRPKPPRTDFGIVVHADARLTRFDVTRRRGLRITGGARTVLDLATVLDGKRFENAVDEAMRTQATTPWHLRMAVRHRSGKAQAGIVKLRRLIHRRGETLVRTRSPLERDFVKLFAQLKLPPYEQEIEFEDIDGRVVHYSEFGWPEAKLVVEVESFRYHSKRKAWAKDVAKYNELAARGWRVLRVTQEHLADPRATEGLIRRALNARTRPTP